MKQTETFSREVEDSKKGDKGIAVEGCSWTSEETVFLPSSLKEADSFVGPLDHTRPLWP